MCTLKGRLGVTRQCGGGQENVTEDKLAMVFQGITSRFHTCACAEQSSFKPTIRCVQMNKQKLKHSSFSNLWKLGYTSQTSHWQVGSLSSHMPTVRSGILLAPWGCIRRSKCCSHQNSPSVSYRVAEVALTCCTQPLVKPRSFSPRVVRHILYQSSPGR